MQSGVVRTSTVLIACDEGQTVYSSLREVPESLRKRLEASTTGRNSGTIVIADRRGKEQIERAAKFERLALRSPRQMPMARPHVAWNQVWPALIALAIGATGAWLALVVRW